MHGSALAQPVKHALSEMLLLYNNLLAPPSAEAWRPCGRYGPYLLPRLGRSGRSPSIGIPFVCAQLYLHTFCVTERVVRGAGPSRSSVSLGSGDL